MKNKKKAADIIRWIARIWGSLSLAFMLLFLGAHLLGSITGEGEPLGKFHSVEEIISFLCFPICIIVGLALAWKWEGMGGLITITGIGIFHIIRPELLFNLAIDGLALQGLLYHIYWILNFKITT
jgi:hypothetical protein